VDRVNQSFPRFVKTRAATSPGNLGGWLEKKWEEYCEMIRENKVNKVPLKKAGRRIEQGSEPRIRSVVENGGRELEVSQN